MRSPRRGRFIVLEGLDGSGTTTQSVRVAARLRAFGLTVHVTCEPSTGPIGNLLRQALTHRVRRADGAPLTDDTLAALFAADRLDHIANEIEPALARGEIVLSDRYVLSSLAYQGATLPTAWVKALNARALKADLTLFVSVDLKTAARRRVIRAQAEEHFESPERQRKTRQQYERALKSFGSRVVRIDGNGSIDDVTEAIMRAISRVL